MQNFNMHVCDGISWGGKLNGQELLPCPRSLTASAGLFQVGSANTTPEAPSQVPSRAPSVLCARILCSIQGLWDCMWGCDHA